MGDIIKFSFDTAYKKSIFNRNIKSLIRMFGAGKSILLSELLSMYQNRNKKTDDIPIDIAVMAKEFGFDQSTINRQLWYFSDVSILNITQGTPRKIEAIQLNKKFITHILNLQNKDYGAFVLESLPRSFESNVSHLMLYSPDFETVKKEYDSIEKYIGIESTYKRNERKKRTTGILWDDLDSTSRELIEYWNSTKEGPKVTLPKSGKFVSKSVIALDTYFKQVLRGSFFRINKISGEIPDHVINREYTVDDIKSAMYNLKKLYKPEYFPMDKKRDLPNTLVNAFVHYSTKQSYIFRMFYEEPVKVEVSYDPPKEILSSYMKLPSISGKQWEVTIKGKLQNLNNEYEIIVNDIGKYYTEYGNWQKYMGSFEKFCSVHRGYLSTFKSLKSGNFSCTRGKKIWDMFVAYVKDKYGINLYPSESEKKVLLMNRKRALISSGKYTPDDFVDEGLYLEGETL